MSSALCIFHLRGVCRYGDRCRFLHVLPEESASHTLDATAKPFVPSRTSNEGTATYAEVVEGAVGGGIEEQAQTSLILCPYGDNCPHRQLCRIAHAEMCDMCGEFCLHPTDREHRQRHINECVERHEKDMELSFAVARSQDKTCGICFDIILEKSGRNKRFGILPNCNHLFCLKCIRTWRKAKNFDRDITRACPECRKPSDYVCPSSYWVETKEEKDKLLKEYKEALEGKDCKYFRKGEGKCPFGNKCFYKHALPNGVRVDVGLPQRHIRKLQRAEDEILDLFDIYLWDFVDQRNYHWFAFDHATDSEDSDWSEEFD